MVRVEVESVARYVEIDCGCRAANGNCDDRGDRLRNEVSVADCMEMLCRRLEKRGVRVVYGEKEKEENVQPGTERK